MDNASDSDDSSCSCVSGDGGSDGPSVEGEPTSSVGSNDPVANKEFRYPRMHSAERLRKAGQMALAALLLQSGLIDQIFAVLLVGKIAATKLATGAWPSWDRVDGPK